MIITKKKQEGLALLVLVITLALTLTTYYFSTISITEVERSNIQKTRIVLKQAKNALLAYAVANWHTNGEAGKISKLPCTEGGTNPTGEQDPVCGNAYANAIGFFPWKTLNSDTLKDDAGSCLIYAVSPAYKNSPAAALNPDSYGQFITVDLAGDTLLGARPEDRPVAVVFAPGTALTGQARNNNLDGLCGADYDNIVAYLDNDGTTDNAAIGADDVIDKIVQIYTGSDQAQNPLNDRFITITHGQFWEVMNSTLTSSVFTNRMRNLTEAIALCFARYGNDNTNHLPMPAALKIVGDYRRDSDYDDSDIFTSGFSGRLPYSVEESNSKLSNSDPTDEIFKHTYCDGLDLTITTPGVNDDINFSDALGSDKGEFFNLWQNWKDHFFYAVSKAHKPSTDNVQACSSDCVSVNGTEYAAVIFFSGLTQTVAGYDQQRYAPPLNAAWANDSIDDKDKVVNYLENGNDARFPNDLGNEAYLKVTAPSNDVMFCIKTDMSVVECL